MKSMIQNQRYALQTIQSPKVTAKLEVTNDLVYRRLHARIDRPSI